MKENIIKYLEHRIKLNKTNMEQLPEPPSLVSLKKKNYSQALTSIGKYMIHKETENMHKGALLELNEILRYIRELK